MIKFVQLDHISVVEWSTMYSKPTILDMFVLLIMQKEYLIFIVRNWECMAPINRLSKISQLDLGPSNTPRLSKKKVCTGIKTKQHLYRHHWKDCVITYSLVKLYGSVLALMSILRLNFWFFLFLSSFIFVEQ